MEAQFRVGSKRAVRSSGHLEWCFLLFLGGLTGAGLLAAAGCAGGRNVQTAPDPATLQPYNGDWILQEIGAPQASLTFAAPVGRGFRRAVAQELGQWLGSRPERLLLEMNESAFRVSGQDPGLPFSLPVDGTGVEIRDEEGQVISLLELTWSHGTPIVRRTLPKIGWISDHYQLTDEGALLITRTAGMQDNAGGDLEAIGALEFVYARVSGGDSGVGGVHRQGR